MTSEAARVIKTNLTLSKKMIICLSVRLLWKSVTFLTRFLFSIVFFDYWLLQCHMHFGKSGYCPGQYYCIIGLRTGTVVQSHLSNCILSCPLVCVRSRHREQITTRVVGLSLLLRHADILSNSARLSVFSEKRKLSSIQDYGSSRHYIAYAFTIQIKKIPEGRIQD